MTVLTGKYRKGGKKTIKIKRLMYKIRDFRNWKVVYIYIYVYIYNVYKTKTKNKNFTHSLNTHKHTHTNSYTSSKIKISHISLMVEKGNTKSRNHNTNLFVNTSYIHKWV